MIRSELVTRIAEQNPHLYARDVEAVVDAILDRIGDALANGLLPRTPIHYVTKHLQQGIESDHFRLKRAMPRVGGFRSFHTARRTICGFEALLWLRKGFGFSGAWTVRKQNQLLAHCFGLPVGNKA